MSIIKKFFALFGGLTVADVVSTAKNRFASWCGASFYFTSIEEEIENQKNQNNSIIIHYFNLHPDGGRLLGRPGSHCG